MLAALQSSINFNDPTLWWAAIIVVFNPLFWNIVARAEYNTHFLTKLCFGSAHGGCYFLAACIFFLGVYRDKAFADALLTQPQFELLNHPLVPLLSIVLYATGLTLVLSSYWRLGITGTYLGDYFGIFMKSRVTGFPFNVMNNPMYNGSTILFFAHALWNQSAAGLLLSLLVHIVYRIALLFEEPFTAMIYSKRKGKQTKK